MEEILPVQCTLTQPTITAAARHTGWPTGYVLLVWRHKIWPWVQPQNCIWTEKYKTPQKCDYFALKCLYKKSQQVNAFNTTSCNPINKEMEEWYPRTARRSVDDQLFVVLLTQGGWFARTMTSSTHAQSSESHETRVQSLLKNLMPQKLRPVKHQPFNTLIQKSPKHNCVAIELKFWQKNGQRNSISLNSISRINRSDNPMTAQLDQTNWYILVWIKWDQLCGKQFTLTTSHWPPSKTKSSQIHHLEHSVLLERQFPLWHGHSRHQKHNNNHCWLLIMSTSLCRADPISHLSGTLSNSKIPALEDKLQQLWEAVAQGDTPLHVLLNKIVIEGQLEKWTDLLPRLTLLPSHNGRWSSKTHHHSWTQMKWCSEEALWKTHYGEVSRSDYTLHGHQSWWTWSSTARRASRTQPWIEMIQRRLEFQLHQTCRWHFTFENKNCLIVFDHTTHSFCVSVAKHNNPDCHCSPLLLLWKTYRKNLCAMWISHISAFEQGVSHSWYKIFMIKTNLAERYFFDTTERTSKYNRNSKVWIALSLIPEKIPKRERCVQWKCVKAGLWKPKVWKG